MQKFAAVFDVDSRSGPPSQFRPWHILAALLTFGEKTHPIGRYWLGKALGLGGGSIRSLLKYLRQQDLIEPIERKGHQLTDKGKKHIMFLKQILVTTAEVPPTSYTLDSYNFGCQLRNRSQLVTDGVYQRDAAIQAGASGASTFVQLADPQQLLMPSSHQVLQKEIAEILENFTLIEGDVLIIGTAPSPIAARLGCLAAALTLLTK